MANQKKPAAKKPAAKKPAAKKPAAKKPAVKTRFGKAFLDKQKASLLEERERYLRSADSLKAEADALLEGREPGDVQFDEESGEGDTLAVARDLDLACLLYTSPSPRDAHESRMPSSA